MCAEREVWGDTPYGFALKVTRPDQPVKLFTTNDTDPGKSYLRILHRATAQRVWGAEQAGQGAREAGGRSSSCHSFSRPPPGGSPLGLQGGSAQGLGSSPRLLTRSHSHQTPLHLLPFLLRQGRPQVWKGREELTISPENVSDTGTNPRDHIMRQTPVCPARQWELPLALMGTMTSDLKFCFLLAFLRSVGSEQ